MNFDGFPPFLQDNCNACANAGRRGRALAGHTKNAAKRCLTTVSRSVGPGQGSDAERMLVGQRRIELHTALTLPYFTNRV